MTCGVGEGGRGGGEEKERPKGMRLVKTMRLRSTRFPLLKNEEIGHRVFRVSENLVFPM